MALAAMMEIFLIRPRYINPLVGIRIPVSTSSLPITFLSAFDFICLW